MMAARPDGRPSATRQPAARRGGLDTSPGAVHRSTPGRHWLAAAAPKVRSATPATGRGEYAAWSRRPPGKPPPSGRPVPVAALRPRTAAARCGRALWCNWTKIVEKEGW